MTVSSTESIPPDRSGRAYIVGTAVLIILSGLLTILASPPSDAESQAYFIGQVTGSAVVIGLIAAGIFAIARALNKGKPRSRSAKITFWIVFAWFVLLLGNFVNRAGARALATPSPVITEEERRALEIGSDSIRHDELGFVLPSPGDGFARDTVAEQQIKENPQLTSEMATWLLKDTVRREVVMIQLLKMRTLDEIRFRQFALGLKKEFSSAGNLLMDSLTWSGSDRSYRAEFRTANGVYTRSRCIPRASTAKRFVVCVQTFSADSNALRPVSDGLRVMP